MSRTVRVDHHRLTTVLRGLDAQAVCIVEAAVPRSGRDRGDVPGEVVVTANRANAAIEALRRAGIPVDETGGEHS